MLKLPEKITMIPNFPLAGNLKNFKYVANLKDTWQEHFQC